MREIIDKAIAILDSSGWTREVCQDDRGRICLGTALCRAAGLPEDGKLTPPQLATWVALTDAVLAAQRELFPGLDETNAVPKFNDYSSESDVRLVLDRMRNKAVLYHVQNTKMDDRPACQHHIHAALPGRRVRVISWATVNIVSQDEASS